MRILNIICIVLCVFGIAVSLNIGVSALVSMTNIDKEILDNDIAKWNNGHCICGGTYKYSNVLKGGFGLRYCFYCEKCNDVVMFSNKVFVKK